ncbi:MAG: trypsin-like serine peptidase [Alphaproteobacteria bacterium]
MKIPLVAILLLLVVPTPAWAGDLKGIKGTDDRITVTASEYPWSAVGRVNNGQGGYCSGVLIGPRLVATAAHCLWNRKTRRPMPESALRFVAGWERGSYLGASEVTRAVLAPDWRFGEKYDPAHAAHDWALLELSEPLGETVGWLALADGRSGAEYVTTVGYGQDRKHVPTAHIGCRLLGVLAQGLLTHDCDAVHGDSGAPVMIWRDGAPLVTAIHVATLSQSSGRTVGGAVDIARLKTTADRMGAKTPGHTGRLSKPLNRAVKTLVEKMRNVHATSRPHG